MGFSDSFNSALRGGAMLQGILYRQEERNMNKQLKRADEFGRGIIALENQYGSKNPKDWGEEGQSLLNDHMNSFADVSGVGDRPNGQAEFNSIVPTGDGVAAIVTAPDGQGGASTGPMTARGSTDDDDPVAILTSTDQLLKPVSDNMQYLEARFAARVNSPKTHEALSELDNQQNTESSLEVLNERFNGGTPGELAQAPEAAAEAPPAPALGGAETNPAAVTSPGPQPPSTPKAAGNQVVSFTPEIDSSIARHAEGHGLDPRVVQALVQTESGGKVDAYNGKAGATGLMQMTPIGLKEFNIQYGKDYTMEDMKDPEKNLEAGTGLLKYYTDKQGGDIQQGLAAFNGGITRLRKNKGDISKMPPETRDYVEKINAMTEAEAPGAGNQEPSAPTEAPMSVERKRDERNIRGKRTAVRRMEEKISSGGKTGRAVLAQRAQLEQAKAALAEAEEKFAGGEAVEGTIASDMKAENEANRSTEPAVDSEAVAKHEGDINDFIEGFNPRNKGQEKVVAELKDTPAAETEEEAVAAAETVKATKPAKKWSDKERKALYTLHRLNPSQFPLKDVVSALSTGRMTKTAWKTFQNGVGQTIKIDDEGNQTVLGNTPENQAYLDAKLTKAQSDASIARVNDARGLQEDQLAQTKNRTDFIVNQATNIHGDDPGQMAVLRDKVNTTAQTMGLNLDAQETPTAINRASRVDQLFNESQGATWYKPWTWLNDAGFTHDLSFAMAVQNVPNSPYDAASPDDGEVVKAAEHYKTEYLDPVQEDFPALGKQKQVQATYMATHLEKKGMSREDAIRVSGTVVGHSRFKTVGEAIAAADKQISSFANK